MSAETIEIAFAERIDCAFEPGLWAWAEENAEAIARFWASLAAGNRHLYDGRVLLLRRVAIGNGVFRGAYLETAFSRFIAWRDAGMPEAGVRNCFAMAALLGADGAFVLGEMAAHTANAGKIYFPAGTPDPADIVDGKVDLAGSLSRELFEETGCDASEFDAEAGWRIVFAGGRIACMKLLQAKENAAPLAARIERWLSTQRRPELARMHVVRNAGDLDAARMPAFLLAYLRDRFAGAN